MCPPNPYDLSRGIDNRPVVPDGEAKSISNEQTFEVNVTDGDEVRRVLLDQVEQVARRLRKGGLHTRGISLKIRYGDFQTISRSKTLESPTDATAELWQAAKDLFDRWIFQRISHPGRCLGLSYYGLSGLHGCGATVAPGGRRSHRAYTLGAEGDADSSRPASDIVLRFTRGPSGVVDMV